MNACILLVIILVALHVFYPYSSIGLMLGLNSLILVLDFISFGFYKLARAVRASLACCMFILKSQFVMIVLHVYFNLNVSDISKISENICFLLQCRKKLEDRQQLISEDVKIDKSFYDACKEDIQENDCTIVGHRGDGPIEEDLSRSAILLCLEEAHSESEFPSSLLFIFKLPSLARCS